MRRTKFQDDCVIVREIFRDDETVLWSVNGLCEFYRVYRGEERKPVTPAYMEKILAHLGVRTLTEEEIRKHKRDVQEAWGRS